MRHIPRRKLVGYLVTLKRVDVVTPLDVALITDALDLHRTFGEVPFIARIAHHRPNIKLPVRFARHVARAPVEARWAGADRAIGALHGLPPHVLLRHVVVLGLFSTALGGLFIDEALARLAPGIALRHYLLEHVFTAAVASPVDVGAISLALALFLAGLESNDTLENLRFRALAIRP